MNQARRPRHVPALDGVRGVDMMLFMAYHFGVTALQGAWVAVNLFFALSGFLIVRLLTQERSVWGEIRILEFYRRRARRLLPALFVLLAAVITYCFFVAEDELKAGLRGDVLATLAYVMNWRLVLTDNQYFAEWGTPSMLKHAWTLAVEEQFYLVVPFLVLLLFRYVRTRRDRALILLGLAVASALWTRQVGVADQAAQAHAYYGTDVRVQTLLVGAAAGLWFAPNRSGTRPRPLPRPLVLALGWGGLAFYAWAFVGVRPYAGWMYYDGGLLLSSLLAAGLVVACADTRPGLLQTILGWRPLAYLGRLSYGLYLWHWPIRIALARATPTWPVWAHVVVGMAITITIAVASWELLEKKVIAGGLRAIVGRRNGRLRSRALAIGCTVALAAAAMATTSTARAGTGVNTPAASWVIGYPKLVPGQPTYTAPTTPVRVTVFGDSVPFLLQRYFPYRNFPGFTVDNLAVPGCDLMDQTIEYPPPLPPPTNDPKCTAAKRNLATTLARQPGSDVILFASPLLAFPHRINGTTVWWTDPSYPAAVSATFDRYLAAARAAGKRLQVVNVPCRPLSKLVPPDVATAMRSRPGLIEEGEDPRHTNGLVASWAARNKVPLIDLRGAVCGAGPRSSVDGIELYGDGIHFSPAATPMVWGWLAPKIIANVEAGR
ncbi:acyltransferase [Calidifontibacter sp. DB0510]|uniref:Acyltransferase n=1 Tax=Metallococcus carri TaxID=1656884 RepID=A0A967E989_9MICO|nr:acyltransferase family protein [Metallococcus carri]NHN54960.1 acyltransferase [Metallococcus carri]NOP37306.1 acyltransferase family protein [Calidifontibacter sp. DB2511S]